MSPGGARKRSALFPYREDSKQRLGNCLVVAYPAAIKRLQTAPPDPRPELAAAFAAVGDMPIQGLLLPPSYTRRVWEETLPALPKELGGFPMRDHPRRPLGGDRNRAAAAAGGTAPRPVR